MMAGALCKNCGKEVSMHLPEELKKCYEALQK